MQTRHENKTEEKCCVRLAENMIKRLRDKSSVGFNYGMSMNVIQKSRIYLDYPFW